MSRLSNLVVHGEVNVDNLTAREQFKLSVRQLNNLGYTYGQATKIVEAMTDNDKRKFLEARPAGLKQAIAEDVKNRAPTTEPEPVEQEPEVVEEETDTYPEF